MFTLTGILKKEEVRKFTRGDGTPGESRVFYIEREGQTKCDRVNCSDMTLKLGKQGEEVTVEVEVFAYYVLDHKRKPAYKDIYIPNKNSKKK